MKISYLPSKFLINGLRRKAYTDEFESDFVLKAIKIKNTSEKSVHIIKYVFELKSNSKSQQTILYSEEQIQEHSVGLSKFSKRFLKERDTLGEIFRKGNLKKMFGTDNFWNSNHFTTNSILEPNQETGLLYEHFRITMKNPIDELVFTVHYIMDGKENQSQISIPVIQYENEQEYIFPVKGTWYVTCNWDDPIEGHREAWSQEFAFDLIQLNDNLMENTTGPNEESTCYGKEVIAIADGEVVECYNEYPENPHAGKTLTETKKQIVDLAQIHPFTVIGAGNYVILKHSDEESSFYAHLIPNSVKVKKGDEVKQGQVLGCVGNSGNSDGPHLHFQLMDAPSHLTGKGLPCKFTNIIDSFGKPVEVIEHSGSIIHTN